MKKKWLYGWKNETAPLIGFTAEGFLAPFPRLLFLISETGK